MGRKKWHWECRLREINPTTGRKYWNRVKVYDTVPEHKEIPQQESGINTGGKERQGLFPVRWIDMVIRGEENKEDNTSGGGEDKA